MERCCDVMHQLLVCPHREVAVLRLTKTLLSFLFSLLMVTVFCFGLKKHNKMCRGLPSFDSGIKMDLKQRLRRWGRFDTMVKLWCCCTTRDCKLYMPNGSLHSSKSGLLDWPMRYKIAMDAAKGLSYYLHHDCAPLRDVKSNNILLDGELLTSVLQTRSMPMLRQSSPCLLFCGYMAPGRIPFSYLEDIQTRFMKNYGKVASYAPAYSMNDEFSRVLHQQMEFFSSK